MKYVPEGPPQTLSPATIAEWVARELARVREAIETATDQEFLNVAPTRPREGMIRSADGVNWNPGAGKGVYVFYSGVWNKLG